MCIDYQKLNKAT
jgi:hypothetical protein